MVAPTDRHGLEVLTLEQCRALIASRVLGRLAYVQAGQPVIVPVNYVLDGTHVVLRSLVGGKLDHALVDAPVAFEVDDHDPAERTGWSVLVRGTASVLDDEALIARLEDQLDSWAVDDPDQAVWIQIVADEISGRRLRRS